MRKFLFKLIATLFMVAAIPLHAAEKSLGEISPDIRPAEIIISPDQNRFAYITRDDLSLYVVVDGRKQRGFDWIVQGGLAFTADSKHVVYAANKRNKSLMVIDGKEGDYFDSIDHWMISQRGGEVAYNVKHNGRAYAVLGDTIGPPFDFVHWHALAGPGGKSAYVAEKSGQQVAVIDGQEGKAYEKVIDVRLSPDGQRIAYSARSRGKWQMVVDGNEGEAFDSVGPAQFTSDSLRGGYLATKNGQSFCIIDNAAKAYPGQLHDLIFSPDGSRHLFISSIKGSQTVFVDGAEFASPPLITSARFSADGQHIAYIARTPTGESVFVDRTSLGEFDTAGSLNPLPGRSTFSFSIMRNEKYFLIAAGQEFGPFDAILGRHPPILEHGSLKFVVLKGRQVIQITASLPATKVPA